MLSSTPFFPDYNLIYPFPIPSRTFTYFPLVCLYPSSSQTLFALPLLPTTHNIAIIKQHAPPSAPIFLLSAYSHLTKLQAFSQTYTSILQSLHPCLTTTTTEFLYLFSLRIYPSLPYPARHRSGTITQLQTGCCLACYEFIWWAGRCFGQAHTV